MFGAGGASFSGVTFFAPGLAAGDAVNGLSVSGGKAVLGNNIGEPGDPAQLLSNREIKMNGWQLSFLEPGNNFEMILFPGQGWSTNADVAVGAGPAFALSAANIPGMVLNLSTQQDSVSGVFRFALSDALSYLNFDALQSGQVWLTQTIDDTAPPFGFFGVIGAVYIDGECRFRYPISTQTDPFSIDENRSGEVFGDVGAAALVNYSLPTITKTGTRFGFFVRDGIGVNVIAAVGDVIYIKNVFGTSFSDNNPGSFIWIVAVAPGVWMAEAVPAGTWVLV